MSIIPYARAVDFPTQTEFQGLSDNSLQSEISEVSDLATGTSVYTSMAAIRRVAERDAARMIEVLVAKGYYSASVQPDYIRSGDAMVVTFSVDTGEKFRIARYFIQYQDQIDTRRVTTFEEAEIKANGDPDGQALQVLEESVVAYLRENGFPNAVAIDHYVQANFKSKSATAIFVLESGQKATFGQIKVSGTEKTNSEFVEKYLTWEPGTLYQRQKTVSYRDALIQTGLFNEVSILPGEQQSDGSTEILVNVSERKRRTVGAGVSFATDVGVGGQLFWENRNLLGQADRFTAQLSASALEQELELAISRPFPSLPGALSGSLTVTNEVSDAFEAQSVQIGTALSKFWFNRQLELSGGLGLNYSQIEDAGVTDTFFYVTVPGIANWNKEDDLLNPTRGFRANLSVTPFIGDVNFVQAKLSAASRRAIGEEQKFILAARGAIGSSFGIARDDIPATERFFAGGGGSVRGFAFQEAGPLDANLDPIGGASIIELNVEARVQARDNMQLAAFIDAGTVSENDVPSLSEEAFVGAGLGIRYMTPIGPFRIDVATPLNRRETDDAVQFYFALGQPF